MPATLFSLRHQHSLSRSCRQLLYGHTGQEIKRAAGAADDFFFAAASRMIPATPLSPQLLSAFGN